MHLLWFVMTFALPAVLLGVFNTIRPSFKTLPSSLHCQDDDRCPLGIVAASAAVQVVVLFYCYVATLFMELLPLAGSVVITRALQLAAEELQAAVGNGAKIKEGPKTNSVIQVQVTGTSGSRVLL